MPLDNDGGCLCSGYLVLGKCNCGENLWDSPILLIPPSSPDKNYVDEIISNQGIPGWTVILRYEETKTERTFHVLNARTDDRGFVEMLLVPLDLVIAEPPPTPEESIEPPRRRYYLDDI